MAKEKINVVRIDTDPAKKSLKDLRKELMEIRNEMVNLEEGSDAFLEMAQKGGELQHQIQEIGESIRGASSDFGDMVGNVSNVAAGLVGAFNAVAGGLQAMGVESEALDETIARMQGLMAVVQGLGSIDTAIKSLDKLRNSITSTSKAATLLKTALTPKTFLAITAVITAVTLVVSKFRREQEELARAQEEYNKKLEEETRLRREAQVKEYLGDLSTELRIKEEIARIKYGDDELKEKKAILKDLRLELNKLGLELSIYANGGSLVAGEDRVAAMQERIDAVAVLQGKIKEVEADITVLEATAPARAAAAAKRKAEEERKAAEAAAKSEAEAAERKKKSYEEEEKIINYLITLYDELNANNPTEKAKENLNLEQRRLANIKSYYGEMSEEYKEQLIIVRDLEAAYAKLTETKEESLSNTEIELALENDRLKEMAKGWLYNEETALETFDRISDELKTALDRDLITQQQYDTAVKNLAKERSRYIVDQSSKAFTATANLATTILDGLADSQDKNNKEGFEKSKKLQIASATINMLSGITAAIAGLFTTKSGPWDIALAAIQAATIAASGAIQINKIKKTTFEGASGTSANISGSASAAMIVPPIQYSNAVTGASIDGNIKDSRVYVTETDIKNTMNKVSVQENENIY